MSIQLNHTIIAAHDNNISANFLAEILGLPAPTTFGPFMVVQTDNGVSLDFRTTTEDFQTRHYAFLVSEEEFDEIFERISKKEITYWADHMRKQPNEINHNDGGRGVYFDDPNGHFLEVITRPYGSGG
ncbi:MAG: VOC family protein [Gammaproteobacteria bacterium]|nr:VOC family protein [Gammaproteobacteria bacterium]